jgi:SAM-dependent methyltransferase
MPWFEDWFDSDAYEVVYQQRDLADARRLIDLIERVARPEPGAALLDVGCGRGRHARLLAERGYAVTCLDLSANALRSARERAEREGLALDYHQADMRAIPFEAAFDGAVNLFTSFGYFEDEADHQRAVDAMAGALKPGGFLVQDFLNAAYAARHIVPADERHEDGMHIAQQRWIEDGRIKKRITLSADGHEESYTESVALLGLPDFERMYAAAGLEITATFGDYHGAPFTEHTPRLVLHARKGGA